MLINLVLFQILIIKNLSLQDIVMAFTGEF
jgi:hypothetical protein